MNAEQKRLDESRARTHHWKRWGPYLAERAWGTVREDYSANGTAWDYFPHDHARSRAYRWNEDGIAGICDRRQFLCFALALWNGQDAILKERLFGLSGPEGNHGEDVKEYYFYLDNTPTHAYLKYLYKYPQQAFPYDDLVRTNQARNKREPEYELLDTGVFAENRYFDVTIEYAKATPEDIAIRITATNRGPDAATLHLLPTLWFRNTWSWGALGEDEDYGMRPALRRAQLGAHHTAVEAYHERYGARYLLCGDTPTLLFTENDTNNERLFAAPNSSPYVKDGINDYLVENRENRVNPDETGTKVAAHYPITLAPGQARTLYLRLTDDPAARALPEEINRVFDQRQHEADDFYRTIIPDDLSPDAKNIARQALAGMLWSKQFYHYVVKIWLEGDPAMPPPPPARREGRNHDWTHLYNADVLSMPDTWEYPWYAAWDLAFHCLPLALLDSDFAKEQLVLLLREWYLHPNGQLPAYEWAFDDVNPPVHAWAAWRVYQIEEKRRGKPDRAFLERVFHKLLLNFTWWVNRKDVEGNNVFEGGFLGLDNIGIFDRSAPLPTGGYLEQSDGTSWMAMYTLNLLAIAMELAEQNPVYEDVASKFWEHFLYIAHAMTHLGPNSASLWDQNDGFFYDVLHLPDGSRRPIKIRSMVGLIPLFAVETLEPERLESLPGFKRRLEWFVENRPDLTANIACMQSAGSDNRRLLSIVNRDQLRRVLSIMLDENEFLSPYGIRSLSRYHQEHPYVLDVNDVEHRVDYEPAESTTRLFGGNSNWRGPIWMPLNYLLIESLQKFHYYYGDSFRIECPTGSGNLMDLWEVAAELSRRLSRIFLQDADNRRPVYGAQEIFQIDPHWQDQILFYEYFHGDNGAGLGASHQTGWTGLIAKLLQQNGE